MFAAPAYRRYGEKSRQRLDVALLHFFQCFRKVYIGEQVMHSSKVYTKLSERLGLDDHLAVLNVMLAKLAKNLQVRTGRDTARAIEVEDIMMWAAADAAPCLRWPLPC